MRGAVEMRFKVGDRVRVLENLTLEDVGHIHDMLEFRGLEATVETVFDQAYHLTVDNHEWYWMDELLEPVEEELEMSNVKFDIPEWVNWLARDSNGALYAYREKPMKCSTVFGASEAYTAGDPNLRFITDDPNHYPQVKWSDEEPKPFKDGITFGSSELDTNEAMAVLRSYGREVIEPEPDMIQNPPHYKQYSFEPIDIITEVVKEYPPEIGFHIGTTLKYLFRSPFKDNLPQDLAKAEYYLQRANKELEESK